MVDKIISCYKFLSAFQVSFIIIDRTFIMIKSLEFYAYKINNAKVNNF